MRLMIFSHENTVEEAICDYHPFVKRLTSTAFKHGGIYGYYLFGGITD